MACWLLLLGLPVTGLLADDTQVSQDVPGTLKKLSLEQLGDIEVTSVSKEPGKSQPDSRGNLRDYAGRYSAVGRHEHPGSAAAGAGGGGGSG